MGDDYGYGYLIPKDDTVIIGSVFFPGSNGCKELHERAVELFSGRYAYRLETLKREAWTAVKVSSVRDVVGGQGRVLLAGEAGGIMSPSSGEGISFALNSGKLAGQAVAQVVRQSGSTVKSDEALEAYRESLGPIKRVISKRLALFPIVNSSWGKWMGGTAPGFVADRLAWHM